MMKKLLLLLLTLCAVGLTAQIKVQSIEQVSLPQGSWMAPVFAPDGKAIFVTSSGYDGIWEYSLASKSFRPITADKGAGFEFAVSVDGQHIAYRKTEIDERTHQRTQEIVSMNLDGSNRIVLARGNDLMQPVFDNTTNNVLIASSLKPALGKTFTAASVQILGIENTKILLSVNGAKRIFDPYPNGSYVWQSLSPDKKNILAYEMARGTFIADLNGTIIAEFGRRDAPRWTRSGEWIIYMDDKDDGHKMTASEICAISPVSKSIVRLTATENQIELYPMCSPTENAIVYNTDDGKIFILRYSE
jgi:Tol biopolymer transport system component